MAHLVGCCVCVCCVLCFVLSPKQSGVLECHLSHYFKNENYERCISAGFFVTGKKRYSRLSVGCAVLAITTGKKKDTVVCLLGVRFWQLRPEKKDTVVCLTGCAVVFFIVVAGNFDYEILITTGKKSMSVFLVTIVIFVLVQLELNLIQIH